MTAIKATGRLMTKLDRVNEYVPIGDPLAFFKSLLDAYQDGQEVRRDLAKIEATRQVLVAEIAQRYDFYHALFVRIFDERKQAIDGYFQTIDRGIAVNDKELILQALAGVAHIVSSSPFTNLDQLAKRLESGQKIEI